MYHNQTIGAKTAESYQLHDARTSPVAEPGTLSGLSAQMESLRLRVVEMCAGAQNIHNTLCGSILTPSEKDSAHAVPNGFIDEARAILDEIDVGLSQIAGFHERIWKKMQ